MKNICEWLLLKMYPWNWETLKFIIRTFNFTLKKTGFFNINIRNKFMIGISWLVSHEVYTDNNISLNKRRSKVQEKNMSCERALNFDQWKTFSENYKPMRAWLWLVYNIYRELFRLRLFSELIQTQKRYSTSLDKIYPNLKTTCHIKLQFFFWVKLLENLLHAKYLISVTAPLTNMWKLEVI